MAPILTKAFAAAAYLIVVVAQRPGNGGRGRIECPIDTQFKGSDEYVGKGPMATPMRGNIGCVDLTVLATRPTVTGRRGDQTAQNIYGPMEAGFTSSVPGMNCLGTNQVPAGVDTNLAEHMVEYYCPNTAINVLDSCGGHAVPYHYHERMSCLFNTTSSGHSTRIGTALDGNGIYGKHVDGGVEPTDLDACGGRTGVTPDSDGVEVYYYSVSSNAPFSVGCFGPVASVEECRALYPTCNGVSQCVSTSEGTGYYDLDCPCFDSNQSNVPGQGIPGYLVGGESLGDGCVGNTDSDDTPAATIVDDKGSDVTPAVTSDVISSNLMVTVAMAVGVLLLH